MLRRLALVLVVLLAPMPARSEPVTFEGRLELGFGLQEPFVIPNVPVFAYTGPSGGFEVLATSYVRPNDAPLSPPEGGFILWPGVFAVTNFDMTPPAPLGNGFIGGVELSGFNGTGVFAPDPNTGKLRGRMPFRGIARLCVFTNCQTPVLPLTITADGVVGAGGRRVIEEDYDLRLTVTGAPWTSGTIQVGQLTARGGPTPEGGISLVTPVMIRTNIPQAAVLPTFWRLTLKPGAALP